MIDACLIRSVEEHDLELLLAWRNDPSIRSFMLTRHEIALEEHRAWFARASGDSSRKMLMIEEFGEPIGYVQFANATPNAISDWGFYAKPDAPKGTGRKLGTTALNHAFHTLNLHKVCGQAIAGNQASIALHQKLGFIKEGFLRDQHRIEGAYHSLVCFGLLKREWNAGETNVGD